jgi:hypothetical protein
MYTIYDRSVSNPLTFVLLVSKSIVRSFNTVMNLNYIQRRSCAVCVCVCVRAALHRALVQQAVVRRHLQAGPQD